ncbi:ABC-2 family transporter protein [Deinococcus hopiensis]|uniref:ABC-2 family transporter protein n=1 Tax=Deinococcus hopiensis TaxID=309885 RepID=UPI000A06A853|nr:ABC-2 family transporter protein [Deinococcus hopiensis]
MKRYLRLVRIFTEATLAAQLEYRANFVGAVLASLAQSGAALLVVGRFMLTEGVISAFIQPNMGKIAEAVRTGSMDFTLLKPIGAQLNVSTRYLNVLRVTDLLVGLGLLVYAGAHLTLSTIGVAFAALLYLCSVVIVY